MWCSSRRCPWLRVVQADVEQQAATSRHTCSSILGAQQHEQAPVIAHSAHTANGQSCKQQRSCGAYLRAPEWPRARAGRVKPKCAAQLALDTISKPLQPIVETSVRLCTKSPELFPTSCSSALADRKSNLNRARPPASSVRSSGPLREPWTDDGTKLEKRCTLPNREICRVHDACRFATTL